MLDLSGISVNVSSLNSSFASCADIAAGRVGLITNSGGRLATLNLYVAGTPGVFTGNIGGSEAPADIKLGIEASRVDSPYALGLLLTLAGSDNNYDGGTDTEAGLQIGDGIHNGSITGVVELNAYGSAQYDIVFDVASGGGTAGTDIFNGDIDDASSGGGSLLKT